MNSEEFNFVKEIIDRIDDLANKYCFGCIYNCPSKRDHTCIDEWCIKVRNYFYLALDDFNNTFDETIEYSNELYDRICSWQMQL